MKNINELIYELKKSFISLKCAEGRYINLFGPVTFPISIDYGITRDVYRWYVWKESEEELSFEELFNYIKNTDSNENYDSLLIYGDFENAEKAIVRVHSCCFTGDVVFSTKCDCGRQLKRSFELIRENESGAVVYLARQEGRGIGLFAKAITHKIQEEYDFDTFESCTVLDIADEKRKYIGIGTILKYFRNDKGVSILSNNPEKLNGLVGCGVNIDQVLPLTGFENDDNKKALSVKKIRANNFIIDR